MNAEQAPARPRQVTVSAVMAIVFDVVLLVSLFDTLGRLNTPETRQALDQVLGTQPDNGFGITTAQVVETLRVLVFVSGALAATALVFAVFVLQRHRAARIGYTVSAGLMLLTVPAAGLIPFFVALAAIPMWSRAARDWYAGRAPAPSGADLRAIRLLSQQGPPPAPAPYGNEPGQGHDPAGPVAGQPPPLYGPPPYGQTPYGQPPPYVQQPVPPPADPAAGQPPPSPSPYGQPPAGPVPYGQPAAAPSYDQQPYAQPYGQPPQGRLPYPTAPGYGGYPAARDPDRRPVTVTVAAILTWVGAGVTGMLMLAFVAILAFDGSSFVNLFETRGQQSNVTLTANQAMAIGWTIAVVFLIWSLVAIVLAVLAFRRSNAARIALVVSSVMAALMSLAGITSGLSAITLIMAIAAVVLLFTGGANQWYSRRQAFPPAHGPWGTQSPQGPAYQQRPPERPKPW